MVPYKHVAIIKNKEATVQGKFNGHGQCHGQSQGQVQSFSARFFLILRNLETRLENISLWDFLKIPFLIKFVAK